MTIDGKSKLLGRTREFLVVSIGIFLYLFVVLGFPRRLSDSKFVGFRAIRGKDASSCLGYLNESLWKLSHGKSSEYC